MNHKWEPLVGSSVAIRALQEEISYAARSDAKVLITGESGVGKEVVARLIHAQSPRNRAPFVTINCAGVPETLLESELFGHVRGSFTGAFRDRAGLLDSAHGGTIFMDEVGEMSLRMQALLLRFLETGEIQRVGADARVQRIDVRVIAATNRNLLERMAAKEFREDLYYRLNVIHLTIAPLRERREDVPFLLHHFLRLYARQYALAEQPELTPEALSALLAYDWPGNVRELKNLAERLIVRVHTGVIAPPDLPPEVTVRPAREPSPAAQDRPSAIEAMFGRMVRGGESFWGVAYEPFMSRDLTRADLRRLIGRGLEETHGSYKGLVHLFNMPPRDYKRFLNFLRKHECHMPFQRYRGRAPRGPIETEGGSERPSG